MTDAAASPPVQSDAVVDRDFLLHRSVLESMTEGVMTVTADGRIGVLNPAASQLLGLAAEEVRGEPFGETFLQHDGLEEFNDAVLASVYDKQVGSRTTVGLRLADDTERSVDVTTSYLVSRRDGAIERLGIVVVLDDVTEVEALRKAERELAKSTRAQNVELREAYREIEAKNEALGSALKKVQAVRVLAMLLVVVLFAGAAWYVWNEIGAAFPARASAPSAAPAEAFTVTVTPRRLVRTLSFVGRLAPREELTVTSPTSGKVETVFFEYGDRVAQGRPLVRLDTTETNRRYLDASVRYLEARDKLRELENWENGPEVKRARQAVALAAMELEKRAGDLTASALLLKQGIIPATEHETAEQQYETQSVQHEAALRDLDEQLSKVDADMVRIARLRLETAATAMRDLESALQNATILAPVSGVVLDLGGDRRRSGDESDGRPLAAGQLVGEGGYLLSIGDLRGLSVTGGVDEVDIVKVQPGQSVRISGDAFSDLVFGGSIVRISAQSRTAGGSAVPTFDVTAAIDRISAAHLARLRLGMSANVTVVVRDEPDVVLVPVAAVQGGPGNYRVQVRGEDGGAPRDVPVEVGETTLYEVEIVSGLEAGDEVIVPTNQNAQAAVGLRSAPNR